MGMGMAPKGQSSNGGDNFDVYSSRDRDRERERERERVAAEECYPTARGLIRKWYQKVDMMEMSDVEWRRDKIEGNCKKSSSNGFSLGNILKAGRKNERMNKWKNHVLDLLRCFLLGLNFTK
jgi:hypothetical protein